MVEITSEEQNKVKRMKRTEDSLRDLWDNMKCTNTWIIGIPEEEEKKKGMRNFWRDYSWKFPQHGKGNSQSSPRGAKSPIQDKPKEKHASSVVTQLCPTVWTAACQASLSITNSQCLLKLMSTESVMPCNLLILCCPLLLPPSILETHQNTY